MVKMSSSVCQRIRRVKNSLENAEQSFLDNKDMRGELDLMLAEAELSNLRRKKDTPWCWNRQMLALCAAIAVAVSCFGGWCYARHNLKSTFDVTSGNVSNSNTAQNVESKSAVKIVEAPQEKVQTVTSAKTVQAVIKLNDAPADKESKRQLNLSDTDMRRLVKSARVELTSSK